MPILLPSFLTDLLCSDCLAACPYGILIAVRTDRSDFYLICLFVFQFTQSDDSLLDRQIFIAPFLGTFDFISYLVFTDSRQCFHFDFGRCLSGQAYL